MTTAKGQKKKDKFVVHEQLGKAFGNLVMLTPKLPKVHLKMPPLLKKKDGREDQRTLDENFKRQLNKAKEGCNRLKNVFAAPLKLVDIVAFAPPKYKKSKEDTHFLETSLAKSFIVSHLKRHQRHSIIGSFEMYDAIKGEIIIKQHDIGDYFYIIQTGTILFEVNGNAMGTAERGDIFGELALFYNAPRAATCIAESDCKLWRLEQNIFRKILTKYNLDRDEETKQLLKKVSFLRDLDDQLLVKIARSLSINTYEKGDVIAQKGEKALIFFLIQSGQVKATDIHVGESKYEDMVFGAGEYWGEHAIMNNLDSCLTATALEHVTILSLERDVIINNFGGIEMLMQSTRDRRFLKGIPLRSQTVLKDHEINTLVSLMVDKKYLSGHVFTTEGKTSPAALYYIRKGEVSICSSKSHKLKKHLGFGLGKGESKIVSEGGYFGNDTLEEDDDGKFGIGKYTAVATKDCVVGVLDLKSLVSVLGKKRKYGDIPLSELKMHCILGAGTFGKVWLVSKKDDKKAAFALKVQIKRELIQHSQAQGVIDERDIMAKLDCDFIIRLVSSYQNTDSVYMLTKLYQGGELENVIHTNDRDGMAEWAATFYAAGVLEGLSHMHRRHIVYRDLKPENVLLDSEGYPVIVDLGFAKIVKDKTYTFCGTPLYIAPEIILQLGHDKGADHWSWGIMLYDMIVGKTPFYHGHMSQMELYKSICKGKFEFPPGDFMSPYSKDLIKKILNKNPNQRLGSFSGADLDIRKHGWFQEMDWEKLKKKEITAPWVPDIKDPLDVSAFDEWEQKETSEKMTPLTAKEQLIFKSF